MGLACLNTHFSLHSYRLREGGLGAAAASNRLNPPRLQKPYPLPSKSPAVIGAPSLPELLVDFRLSDVLRALCMGLGGSLRNQGHMGATCSRLAEAITMWLEVVEPKDGKRLLTVMWWAWQAPVSQPPSPFPSRPAVSEPVDLGTIWGLVVLGASYLHHSTTA